MTISEKDFYASYGFNYDQEKMLEDYVNKKLLDMLEDLHEKMRQRHEDYFEQEDFDTAYGIDIAMDEVKQKIKELVIKEYIDKKE